MHMTLRSCWGPEQCHSSGPQNPPLRCWTWSGCPWSHRCLSAPSNPCSWITAQELKLKQYHVHNYWMWQTDKYMLIPVGHDGRLINYALTTPKWRGVVGYLDRINEFPSRVEVPINLNTQDNLYFKLLIESTHLVLWYSILLYFTKTSNYLKADNTTKASHLALGNVMFWVTWQARIVYTCNLGIWNTSFS